MNRNEQSRKKASGRGRATKRSLAEVPPAGAVEGEAISSVDVDPRSNGENDWQDEMPTSNPNPRNL